MNESLGPRLRLRDGDLQHAGVRRDAATAAARRLRRHAAARQRDRRRPSDDGRLLLTTYRTLYTSLEGASILSEEADKLHREEFLEINPADAQALGIGQNRPVVVQNGVASLELTAALTDAVPAGSVFLPLYYQGGIVNRLLHGEDALAHS